MKIRTTGRLPRARTAALGALVLALVLAATAAAAVPGDPFKLGVTNTISALTTLTGSVAGRMLQVTNSNTATTAGAIGANSSSTTASTVRAQNAGGGPALEAVVPSGRSPMRVSAGAAKVANLDADKLDGVDSSQVQRRVSGACAVGSSIRAISSTGTVTCETKAADADKLDGKDSADFYSAGGKVADSAHADAADSATNATTATNATNAANSDTLDGIDSTGFYAAGSKVADSARADIAGSATTAANADKLDGRDSSAFMQGAGEVVRGARAIPQSSGGWYMFLTTVYPQLKLGYICPADLNANGTIVFQNNSPEVVNVFIDNGDANPQYRQVAANGGEWRILGAATGERLTIQVQGSQVATIEAFTAHRAASNDCHTQAMAIISR